MTGIDLNAQAGTVRNVRLPTEQPTAGTLRIGWSPAAWNAVRAWCEAHPGDPDVTRVWRGVRGASMSVGGRCTATTIAPHYREGMGRIVATVASEAASADPLSPRVLPDGYAGSPLEKLSAGQSDTRPAALAGLRQLAEAGVAEAADVFGGVPMPEDRMDAADTEGPRPVVDHPTSEAGHGPSDIEDQVLEFLDEAGPASGRAVAAGVRRRAADVRTAISALKDAGRIEETDAGLLARPAVRDAPQTAG